MSLHRLTLVVGARPQFIKAAAIYYAYKTHRLRRHLKLSCVHTGQHYDYKLSGIFFDELNIPKPDYHLGVGSGSHATQTASMLKALEPVLKKEHPDLVLVFGDTNSTLAASLVASKLHIPIAHVEAGLRSFNQDMPEEINRIITDKLSDLHFCPTKTSVSQLLKEGFDREVYYTGDIMADILYRQRAVNASLEGEYYLATIHRNTNTDDPKRLANLIECLGKLNKKVIWPIHPRTRNLIAANSKLNYIIKKSSSIELREPQPYKDMISLQRSAFGVLTDSGGVQKEAFMLGVPCITLRRETEWVETVGLGLNCLMPEPTPDKIKKQIEKMRARLSLLTSRQRFIYGKGDAGRKIIELCVKFIKENR